MVKGKEEKRKILRLYYQNEDIFIVNLAGLPEKAFLDEQYKNLDIVEQDLTLDLKEKKNRQITEVMYGQELFRY